MGKNIATTSLYMSPPDFRGGNAVVERARRTIIHTSYNNQYSYKSIKANLAAPRSFWDAEIGFGKPALQMERHPHSNSSRSNKQFWIKTFRADGGGPCWAFHQTFYSPVTVNSSGADRAVKNWENSFQWSQQFNSDVVENFELNFSNNRLLGGDILFSWDNSLGDPMREKFVAPEMSASGFVHYIVDGVQCSLFSLMRNVESVDKGLAIAAYIASVGGVTGKEYSGLVELSHNAPLEVVLSACAYNESSSKLYTQLRIASGRGIFNSEGFTIYDFLDSARTPFVIEFDSGFHVI